MDADGWDQRYAEGRQWSVEPNAFFAEIVENLGAKPGKAIDLACGEGRNAVWLAQRGWRVTAVDFSSVGIERGKAGAAQLGDDDVSRRLTWQAADLGGYDLGQQAWDLVAHVYLHWPTETRIPFLERCAAAVAPGGHFVLVGHDLTNIDNGWGGPQDADVLTTPDALRTQLEAAGLEVLRAELAHRDLSVPAEGDSSETAELRHATAIDHVAVARRPVSFQTGPIYTNAPCPRTLVV